MRGTLYTLGLLRRCDRGVAFIEFALAAPFLILLILGAIEISNYIYATQKVQNASYNVLNLINLQNNLTSGQLDRIAEIVPGVVEPLPLDATRYAVYVTAMQKDAGADPYIRWQHPYGNLSAGPSRFEFDEGGGRLGNPVSSETLKGYPFSDGDQLIAVEVYMLYEPLLRSNAIGGLFGMRGDYMYFFAAARPRKGAFQFEPDELSED